MRGCGFYYFLFLFLQQIEFIPSFVILELLMEGSRSEKIVLGLLLTHQCIFRNFVPHEYLLSRTNMSGLIKTLETISACQFCQTIHGVAKRRVSSNHDLTPDSWLFLLLWPIHRFCDRPKSNSGNVLQVSYGQRVTESFSRVFPRLNFDLFEFPELNRSRTRKTQCRAKESKPLKNIST